MIPTFRLLIFLLLGSLLVAGVALAPTLLWLALAYTLAVGALVAADYFVTPRPDSIEAERINDTKLSIGADNLVTLLLANRSPRALSLQVRDEYPHELTSDTVIATADVAPYGLAELRYHLRPQRRGQYAFGDINVRYLSTLKTFVRQARYPAAAPVSRAMSPSTISIWRWVRSASLWSWVTRITVTPSRCSCSNRWMISAPVFWSRLPVGSSARSTAGRLTRARAMATRWRCPPES